LGSAAVGINNLQDVVGLYATKGLYSAGFKLSHCSFTTGIDDPASSHSEGNGSRLFAINDLGFIAGAYQTDPIPTAPFGVSHGFMFAGGDLTGAYIVDLTGENYRGFVAYRKH
jgi:hypothetical protein